MALEDFLGQWKELEDTRRLAGSMSNNRQNSNAFQNSYTEFQGKVSAPFKGILFQEHEEYDEGTINSILVHAGAYTRGLEDYTLNSTRNGLDGILDGIKAKLGDSNLVGYIAMFETRTNEPAEFVNKLKAFKDAAKPLSRENPQPQVIKEKLVGKINEAVGQNPDEKTRTIAEALKGLYNIESVANGAYAQIFLKPAQDAVKQALGDEWKKYMIGNIGKYSRDEQIAIFSDMYKRFKEE